MGTHDIIHLHGVRSLGKLTHTLRDRSGSRAQHSALMGAIGAEELLVESSNRLTHYLGVFNVCFSSPTGITINPHIGTRLE